MFKIICLLVFTVCYANGQNRILGGMTALQGQFPYAVSLQRITNPPTTTRGHFCGGVLITLQHVLTAASCLHNANGVLLDTTTLRVFAGSVTLTTDHVDNIRNISLITVHNDYQGPPAYRNDIAVITLQAPFLNVTVTPLALPPATFNPVDDTRCVVAGWGATTVNEADQNTQLTFANKYIFNQDLCTSIYTPIPTEPHIFNFTICAGAVNGVTAGCSGDIGNGLVCNTTLTGLLYRSTGCSVVSSHPELYIRVNNYTQWIRDITGSGYSFTPALFMLVLAGIVQVFATKIVS